MKRKWIFLPFFILILMPLFLASETSIQQIESQLDTLPIADKIDALNILSSHYRISNQEKSLDYAFLALDLSQSIQDSLRIYESLESCATVYGLHDEFENAKKYFEQALAVNAELNLLENDVNLYSNLAYVEQALGNTKKALVHYERLSVLYEQQEMHSKKADVYSKMAQLYKELELYDLALEYYARTLESDEEQIKTILSSDQFLKHFGDDSTAVAYYNLLIQSQNLKELTTQTTSDTAISAEELAELQKKESELQKLLEKTKLDAAQKDKTLNEVRQDKLETEMQIKQKDIELKDYKLELQQKELDIIRQKTQRTYFLIVILVFLFMVVLNFLMYSLKQKDNRILEQANAEVHKKNKELILMNKKLEAIARTDPLTNLSNRRDMLEKLEYEKVRFSRGNQPFVIIICDIDNFKNLNDTYGHEFGDDVLKRISRIMESTLRKQDVVSRWGGEEFLLLLPDTSLNGGIIAADKLRRRIQQENFEQSGKKIQVTMTFGVEIFDKIEETIATINRADQALYHGKKTGKNKVVTYENMKK